MIAEKNLEHLAKIPKTAATDSIRRLSFTKRFLISMILLLIAFLFGLIPMWLSNQENEQQRIAAQANLRISKIQNRLATAAINVRKGEYEVARVSTSDFFTDLRSEIDRRGTAFSAEQLEAVKPILAQRDEMITLLARNDPSTADRLTALYLDYVKIVNPPLQKAN